MRSRSTASPRSRANARVDVRNASSPATCTAPRSAGAAHDRVMPLSHGTLQASWTFVPRPGSSMVITVQFQVQLARFGAKEWAGNAVGVALARELGPVMTALMVGGRVAPPPSSAPMAVTADRRRARARRRSCAQARRAARDGVLVRAAADDGDGGGDRPARRRRHRRALRARHAPLVTSSNQALRSTSCPICSPG